MGKTSCDIVLGLTISRNSEVKYVHLGLFVQKMETLKYYI